MLKRLFGMNRNHDCMSEHRGHPVFSSSKASLGQSWRCPTCSALWYRYGKSASEWKKFAPTRRQRKRLRLMQECNYSPFGIAREIRDMMGLPHNAPDDHSAFNDMQPPRF